MSDELECENLSEYKPGWYMRDDEWFLTFGAVLEEFNVTKKELQ